MGSAGDSHDPLAHPRDGVPANSPAALVRPQALIEAVAAFVRELHASPLPEPAGPAGVEAWDVDSAFERAAADVAAGRIDPARFDEPYRSQTPRAMLEMADGYRRILAARPPARSVRVHGDLRLETLLLDEGRVVGWPEVPTRIGDPWADYASLARSCVAVLGPGSILALFEQLDPADTDPIRLEYWVCIGQIR